MGVPEQEQAGVSGARLSEAGLSEAEAAARLAAGGPNELRRDDPPSPWAILWGQLKSPMVALLAGAAVVSAWAARGERHPWADAAAIGVIVAINALVGFAQEYRAERSLQALRGMTAPRARVRRGGVERVIAAREVVAGDRLLLEAGDIVAADARLIRAHMLTAVEAALTGESLPVAKRAEPAPAGAPLAERHDHVFLGTHIAAGSAEAEVVATGRATEVGRISELLAGADRAETPLQAQLAVLSRTLLFLCLGVVGAVGALGLWQGRSPAEVLLGSVSLAVAAVPEGLPAVVTIALAVGVQRMAARSVLVRRLPAVEGLGAVSLICTDKTGTLTTGVMSVRELHGPDPRRLLEVAAACCDATLPAAGAPAVGDPTEIAVLAAAAERGVHRAEIEAAEPRLHVQPFDPDRKRMSVVRAVRDGAGDGRRVLYVKGAPERLIPLAAGGPGGAEADREGGPLAGLAEALADMSGRGLRVIAAGWRELAPGEPGEDPSVEGLTLAGLIGMADPPRPEAVAAIAAARAGGVRTVMITGDHPITARAIARELGILAPGEPPEGLVYARATPEDKINVVRAARAAGRVVAMTGDGANDAPAIREAHVGIAMGRTGTEVSREAAAIVLADDNFASIVEGIREGRTIYNNIRKTLIYLLSGNAAELMIMLFASLAALPIPLLPLHLLWINLLTDGLPALALVMDPPDRDALRRPPRPADEPLLGPRQWRAVLAAGAAEAAVVLALFAQEIHGGAPLPVARNVAFSALVFSELFRSFAARSPDRIFFGVGATSNLLLLAVVGLSALFQIGLQRSPELCDLLQIAPLSGPQLLVAVAAGLVPVTLLEVWKLRRA